MIKLKQINGETVVVNGEMITYVRARPDTVITLSNGDKLMVEETPDQVIDKVIEYKQKIIQGRIKKEES